MTKKKTDLASSVEERTPEKKTQDHFDGMEPPTIKEIDQAAVAYVARRDARMVKLDEEVEAKGVLIELMKKHDLKFYKFDGHEVTVKSKDDEIKVKTIKPEAESVE